MTLPIEPLIQHLASTARSHAGGCATAAAKTLEEEALKYIPGYIELLQGEFKAARELFKNQYMQNPFNVEIGNSFVVSGLKVSAGEKYPEVQHFMEQSARDRLNSLRFQAGISQEQKDILTFNFATSFLQSGQHPIGEALYTQLLNQGGRLNATVQEGIKLNKMLAPGKHYQYLLTDYTAV